MKTKVWLLTFILVLTGMTTGLAGCTTMEANEPQFDIDKIYCPSGNIEYCTGHNPTMLACSCVKKDRLIEGLRNSGLFR